VSSVLELDTSTIPTDSITCAAPRDQVLTLQEGSGATEESKGTIQYPNGASFEPPRRRRRQLDPTAARTNRRLRRVERWRRMDIHQLVRERAILIATARKSTNQKQKAILEYQVKELEHELGKKRSAGLSEMSAAAAHFERPEPRPLADVMPRGASQVTQIRAALSAEDLCKVIGTDPAYTAWAHQRFEEMLQAISSGTELSTV
jgi:hypothetical protein